MVRPSRGKHGKRDSPGLEPAHADRAWQAEAGQGGEDSARQVNLFGGNARLGKVSDEPGTARAKEARSEQWGFRARGGRFGVPVLNGRTERKTYFKSFYFQTPEGATDGVGGCRSLGMT
jgi:hypothetical protein